MGGDGDGFLSKQSVWVIDDGEKLMLCCGLIVPEGGYGCHVYRSVLGIGMVVGGDRGMSHWAVGQPLAGWKWADVDRVGFCQFGVSGFSMAQGEACIWVCDWAGSSFWANLGWRRWEAGRS